MFLVPCELLFVHTDIDPSHCSRLKQELIGIEGRICSPKEPKKTSLVLKQIANEFQHLSACAKTIYLGI